MRGMFKFLERKRSWCLVEYVINTLFNKSGLKSVSLSEQLFVFHVMFWPDESKDHNLCTFGVG